jgi:hypothetical protein
MLRDLDMPSGASLREIYMSNPERFMHIFES